MKIKKVNINQLSMLKFIFLCGYFLLGQLYVVILGVNSRRELKLRFSLNQLNAVISGGQFKKGIKVTYK